MGMRSIHINFPTKLLGKLEKEAEETGMNKSEIIRRALQDFLEAKENKRRVLR